MVRSNETRQTYIDSLRVFRICLISGERNDLEIDRHLSKSRLFLRCELLRVVRVTRPDSAIELSSNLRSMHYNTTDEYVRGSLIYRQKIGLS